MARQTRAQRRARRAQMNPSAEAALPGGPPAPPRRPAARAEARPEPTPAREPRAARGSGVRGFVAESIAELKKVEWPTQSQLIQGVVVVLIACLVVGVFLYTCDLVWKRLVQDVFL
jgi:preprotein translocase subunit SecE